MTWEERLLFLMFLDYKGVLEKWERNHNEDKAFSKIDDKNFSATGGFYWDETGEGHDHWRVIINGRDELSKKTLKVKSMDFGTIYTVLNDNIQVGCQTVTKKDALKIADFIYECFGENE